MGNLPALTVFTLFVLALLAVDLGFFHRRARSVAPREAAVWSAVWALLALSFCAGVYFLRGPKPGLEFLAGYILEGSLSLDNVFIFALTFSALAIPREDQHRVLFWGILGAIVARGIFISAGAALLGRFHWFPDFVGAFLVFAGAKFFFAGRKEVHPERHPALRVARRLFSISEQFEGSAFFIRRAGRTLATPLFVALLLIETTDVLFAVDSIPAVFAVTHDPFIVYTSNVFAVLELRATYFLLAGAIVRFRYLRVGLSLLLVFAGVKILVARFYPLPTLDSLLVICGIIMAAVFASLRPATNRAGGV